MLNQRLIDIAYEEFMSGKNTDEVICALQIYVLSSFSVGTLPYTDEDIEEAVNEALTMVS